MQWKDKRARLQEVLDGDLDFHDQQSDYASHNFHSFPAKFPPQLPGKFIEEFTLPGDLVLDPMAGSGTTIVEARLQNRIGLGFDIDPLAILLTYVKTVDLDPNKTMELGIGVLQEAKKLCLNGKYELEYQLRNPFDEKTQGFVDYWFSKNAQIELLALGTEIEKVKESKYQKYLQLVFSSIIITKSGGVSFAFDLAHTRPHRAKVAINQDGKTIFGHEYSQNSSKRIKLLTKKLRSPLVEFQKRLAKNNNDLIRSSSLNDSNVCFGNAEKIPLKTGSIDLIVTSPPYASNAIDYIRAHKFSLVWLGHTIDVLGEKRKEYIGAEAVSDFDFEPVPGKTQTVVNKLATIDNNKARVLKRYYSEMTRALKEMARVLKPGGIAAVVVGNSIMRGMSTETAECLAEIGERVGLEVSKIGIRNLDRNRRMMPVSGSRNNLSQIQQRMHEEYVIGLLKPGS